MGVCQKCNTSIGLKSRRKYCEGCSALVKRESSRVRAESYRNANREKILERRRHSYQNNVETERSNQKAWRERNKDWFLEWRREKHKKNPESARNSVKRYALKNKEKVKERFKSWKENNKSRFNELKRLSYGRNRGTYARYKLARREHIRVIRREWVDRNRLHVRIKNIERRSLKVSSGKHTLNEFLELCDNHLWKCAYCRIDLDTKTVTEDHVIPLSKGGSNLISNIVPSCLSCNCKKGTKTVEEFTSSQKIMLQRREA